MISYFKRHISFREKREEQENLGMSSRQDECHFSFEICKLKETKFSWNQFLENHKLMNVFNARCKNDATSIELLIDSMGTARQSIDDA